MDDSRDDTFLNLDSCSSDPMDDQYILPGENAENQFPPTLSPEMGSDMSGDLPSVQNKSQASKCPHCHREFTNLRHHINQQHMQVKNFKCGDCGYSCYLKTDLERHISNVHDKHRSPCLICGKKYSDLRQHVRIVHEGAKAECPHCKGKYSNLSQHIHKVHLKTKNVMCEKCGMTFYHNSNLRKIKMRINLFVNPEQSRKLREGAGKHIENTHTQHKSIQTVNNNYLAEYDRHQAVYSPTYQPNYWPHAYDHHHAATTAATAAHTHPHTHAHWYYSQNSYYASRQWW